MNKKSILAAGMAVAMCLSPMQYAMASEGTADSVTIGVSVDWSDISPFGTVSNGRTAVRYTFYEYMAVRKDFGAELEDMELECAKEITKVDDLTYDVEMYDYITDSEGNAITAADYAWAATEMKETGNYEKINSYLDSVTAIDDYTVEIKLTDNPLGTIEYILDVVPVISQAAYEASGDGMATKPVTTAAYSVENMIAGSTLTLVKNENYWQTDDSVRSVVSTQNVDTITYKVVTEATQMATALQTGEIDVAHYMDTSVISSFYADGTATSGYQVEELNSNVMYSILPSMSENSILSQSVELREAIYYAIDASSCMIAATGGYGTTLSAMANPLSGDYDDAWDERDYYEYNVETAQEKLAESGVDVSGVTLKILTLPTNNLDKVAQVIQAELLQIGINSEIVAVEDALYQTYKLDDTQFDLILDIKGTDDYVTFPWSLLFDNRSFDGGVTANFIADDELQSLLETVLSPDTHSEETVDAFESYLEENAYCYGLYTGNVYVIAREGVISSFDYMKGSYLLPGCCVYE
ncbi:MAG: ABC transporter substrate-binding protein [Lachnospiraceae bacterium]|nr:ABC transporter substrate-binding protein [Lachnospiraceae bacterium]